MSATHQLTLDEAQRQLILMSLARLSIERPGYETAVREIASQIDDDHLSIYNSFKLLREKVAPNPRPPLLVINKEDPPPPLPQE